jgi:uncharacterized integral membrane protein
MRRAAPVRREHLQGGVVPLRTLAIAVVAVLLALFVAVNWTAFTTPTTLSMIFGTVQAPLGLVMLVVTGVVAAVFVTHALWLQGSVLLEARRMARELASQRQLADQAEASRFTELRTLIEARLDAVNSAIADDRTAHSAAIARLGDELRLAIEQAANGHAAQLGELQDRLSRSRPD